MLFKHCAIATFFIFCCIVGQEYPMIHEDFSIFCRLLRAPWMRPPRFMGSGWMSFTTTLSSSLPGLLSRANRRYYSCFSFTEWLWIGWWKSRRKQCGGWWGSRRRGGWGVEQSGRCQQEEEENQEERHCREELEEHQHRKDGAGVWCCPPFQENYQPIWCCRWKPTNMGYFFSLPHQIRVSRLVKVSAGKQLFPQKRASWDTQTFSENIYFPADT